jgi:hypothetical protein
MCVPARSLEQLIEQGSFLCGSPATTAEHVGRYHDIPAEIEEERPGSGMTDRGRPRQAAGLSANWS